MRRRRRSTPGMWLGLVAAALVLLGLFCAGIGLGQNAGILGLPRLFGAGNKPPPGRFPVLGPSQPTRIVIPTIDVRAQVHGVGRDDSGAIAAPPLSQADEAGWFTEGPSPGQYGPAILVGHVDTKDRPAVFHRLGELRAGDRIEITRTDRRVAVFEVNSVETFSKSQLPAARVFNDYSRPALRLITCGGAWVGGDLGYASNVIVFASLVSVRRS